MKKLVFTVLTGLIVFLGCSSKGDLEGINSTSDAALEKTGLKGAPSWALAGGKGPMSATGSSKIGTAGFQFARNQAMLMARDALARQAEVDVRGIINSSVASANTGMDAEQADTMSSQTAEQTVNKVLKGTKQIDAWINEEGTEVFVLVQLDPALLESFKKNIKETVVRSQEFKAESKAIQREITKNLDEGLNKIKLDNSPIETKEQ